MIWKHNILKTLSEWGITGNMFNFIKSFMENRTFRVLIGNTRSTEFHQENGVCQGSIISVNLFLVGINNLTINIDPALRGLLYADDFVLYIKGRDLAIMKTTMQQALRNLENWSAVNGLLFSMHKTSALIFSRKKNQLAISPLEMYNTPIQFVTQHKFLGLTFDSRLSWVPHINELHAKSVRKISMLKTLSHKSWGASRSSLVTIYKSLILSKLDYGCMFYSSARAKILKS